MDNNMIDLNHYMVKKNDYKRFPVISGEENNRVNFNEYNYQLRVEQQLAPKRKLSKELLNSVREYLSENHTILFQESIIDRVKRKQLFSVVSDFISNKKIVVDGYSAVDLTKSIINTLAGLDVLEDFLDDDAILNINVNGHREIYIEQLGIGYFKSEKRFDSVETLRSIAMKIANASGESLSAAKPYADCYFPNLRIHIDLDGICQQGISISIRKFPKYVRINDETMRETQQANDAMIAAFEAFVKAKFNILIVGATGSGKTEFLKYLFKHVQNNERVFMLEDTPETRLKELYPEKHILSYLTRDTGDPKTTINYEKLLEISMRNNPNRIALGEIRGNEVVPMLEIYNTGHPGGITSAHAESAAHGVKKLIQMCMRAGVNMETETLGKWITSTFDIVIYLEQMDDNTHRIREVIELLDFKQDKPIYTSLFRLKPISILRSNDGRVKKIECQHIQEGFLSTEKAARLYEKANLETSVFSHLISEKDREEFINAIH